jgi:hypothetical protein
MIANHPAEPGVHQSWIISLFKSEKPEKAGAKEDSGLAAMNLFGVVILFRPIGAETPIRENGFNQFQDLLVGRGALHDEMVGPEFISRFPVFGPIVAGQNHHHDSGVLLLDVFGQVEAVFPRQFDIHEDEVGEGVIDLFQGHIPIRRLFQIHGGKPGSQYVEDSLAEKGIVLYNQNSKNSHPFKNLPFTGNSHG